MTIARRHRPTDPRRRRILGTGLSALAVAAVWPYSVRAALPPTPAQTAGPFYPRERPAEHDADLLRVGTREARALGAETWIEGRVLDTAGDLVPDALVEIWQCDANGRYHHPLDRRPVPPDDAFQGYGQTLVDAAGGYRFRTIRPVAYPGRTPHIHFRVSAPGVGVLVTQMYVRGEPLNERDGVLRGLRDPAARERLMVDLVPADGVLGGRFDLVLARR